MAVLKLQRELFGVTLSLASFSFANGLLGVFIPLLLLDAGAPLWQVPAFYVAYAVVKLFINFPIARYIVQLRGVHTAFAIGFGAAIIQFVSLQMFVKSHDKWWILISAAALAVVNACMWISQHLHISAVVKSATRTTAFLIAAAAAWGCLALSRQPSQDQRSSI